MKYYAHTREDGERQTVKAHLTGVSEKAEKFSVDLLKPIAKKASLYHDIGKYALNFQKRLDNDKVKFSHAACGALEYKKFADKNDCFAPLMEYCIAGHHTGLMDGGTVADSSDSPTLSGTLKRENEYTGESDYSAYATEIEFATLTQEERTPLYNELLSAKDPTELIERYAFFTKYVFSCLTDADFLDTEIFCNKNVERGMSGDFKMALDKLNRELSDMPSNTPLRQARSRIQQQAFDNSVNKSHISILDMPTGSGKTLCSLKLALESGKKRIIYVIPYTSIIEQTANKFEKMFGDVLHVLQHHSNYSYDGNTEEEKKTAEKLKKTCENWDAPLIITTSVQFFQSIYHYKGSALRKLHNLRDSVIVFDEIHLIPTELLRPCLKAVGYITKYLNSEALFLSATMPDYSKLFDKFLPDVNYNKLVTDRTNFKYFKKCEYKDMGRTTLETIAENASRCKNALIVVNTKKTAAELYYLVQGEKYHLSANMTPAHRSRVIEVVRKKLENGEHITVVSTSLVEAGVDLDFNTVFRQLSGLDSILQAGGRCNREGKDDKGYVYVFDIDETYRKGSDLAMRINKTKGLLEKYQDITSYDCIKEYYDGIFDFNQSRIAENSIAKYNEQSNSFDRQGLMSPYSIPFRSYAMQFEYISADTISIVIDDPNDQTCHELVETLRNGDMSVRRALQKYSVSVYMNVFKDLYSQGVLNDHGTGIFILENQSYYNNETGLTTEAAMQDYFI
ncbi:CRISPR-associated helicase Cas3' [Ruminococcus bicirculans (ex Wegman et al. 2014)]|uniref:CRISPR-associated helicase Cas3' n=1 Tax=Ruminococcus bicirculans (ex Wegman et al. 2014) TaxID=1160721 RepID=UPI00242E301C|nr:CRISPR-associated helicase Cas3' [Ruminococcus bicirculans (ex Wegman et al. 2014)]